MDETVRDAEDAAMLEAVRACLQPGRPTQAQQEVRAMIAEIVADFRARHYSVKRLAAGLQCSERTIQRLARQGRTLTR
jgi:hypothetical protein